MTTITVEQESQMHQIASQLELLALEIRNKAIAGNPTHTITLVATDIRHAGAKLLVIAASGAH